jgi:glucose/mannose-6-phosphate isomerase
VANLDNPEIIKTHDPGNMYGAILDFPEQVRNAVKIGDGVTIDSASYKDVMQIIVCGMGGSAIGGDLARSFLSNMISIPIYMCRNYDLPAFVGDDSLVIGSSYSGNTEETLSAFGQALDKKCRLFVMTTGGRLGEIADDNDIPKATLPPGLQPRAALGYSFAPLMLFFHKIGLSEIGPNEFVALADFLEKAKTKLGVDAVSSDNLAKQLAARLYGRIPIIYSGPDLTDAVATRIKGQICENAKMLAFANQFPEFNHNELVGWKTIDAFRDHLKILILRDQDDHHRVAARMDVLRQYFDTDNIEVIEVHSEGNSRLERMFSLIQLGDFVSYYLSILNRVDPTPVEPIDFLKNELAKIE